MSIARSQEEFSLQSPSSGHQYITSHHMSRSSRSMHPLISFHHHIPCTALLPFPWSFGPISEMISCQSIPVDTPRRRGVKEFSSGPKPNDDDTKAGMTMDIVVVFQVQANPPRRLDHERGCDPLSAVSSAALSLSSSVPAHTCLILAPLHKLRRLTSDIPLEKIAQQCQN